MPHIGGMIYETKTALVLRKDLAAWQVANVCLLYTSPSPRD